jgi:hypothetical protein
MTTIDQPSVPRAAETGAKAWDRRLLLRRDRLLVIPGITRAVISLELGNERCGAHTMLDIEGRTMRYLECLDWFYHVFFSFLAAWGIDSQAS